jgi:protein-S-isoprenylcysteine O-methyltransferase Ste14
MKLHRLGAYGAALRTGRVMSASGASLTASRVMGASGASLTVGRVASGQTLTGEWARHPAQNALDWGLLGDLAARGALVVLFSMMAMRFAEDFLATGRIVGLMLVVSELLVVVMTLFRRRAASVDRGLRARVLTTLSLIGPPLVRPVALVALAPQMLTAAISVTGLLIVIGGKLSLGRSFGLIPANRGIVSSGLYRLVRHPIYMGYLVTHVAFVIANPSVWNVVLLVAADAALLARAVCEEATLATDPAYRAYQTKVRWRVCPGVF